MNKDNKIENKNNSDSPLGARGKFWLRSGLLVLAGLLLGWLLFYSPKGVNHDGHNHEEQGEAQAEIWTCSMHPEVRKDEPGKCPLCAMDLIPMTQTSSAVMDPDAVHFSPDAAALANVGTTVVSYSQPAKEVRLYGKVEADERMLQTQVAHIGGRIERLMVNFTGEQVRKGQLLAVLYSPELATAQQELLEASKSKQLHPEIYEASKERLRQWKLTGAQIAQIENSGKVKTEFEVYSNTSGVITNRRVNNGDYVSQGTVLYDVANLSTVWVLFEAYESDLSFLKVGNTISFTMQAIPEKTFSAPIKFIDQVIDPVNRVAKVRVEVSNSAGNLKPGMFATGIVKSNLTQYKDKLVIPRSAVLWTGKRSVVYVKQPGTEDINFQMREIETGPMLGNSYVVLSGLEEGEEIVTDGAFSVDAAAQLAGKPSMMNRPQGLSDEALAALKEDKFMVGGLCEMCKERIEKTARTVEGVATATWTAENQMLQVRFDPDKTNVDTIQKAIAAVGHDAGKYKASNTVYDMLPACCLYRKK